MSKGKAKEIDFDAKEALAKSFALLVAESPKDVNDDIIQILKEEFTDAEISELCAFICYINAAQTFGAIFNLT